MGVYTGWGKIGVLALLLCFLTECTFTTPRTIAVRTTVELQRALADARPGQTIVLADGLYVGKFVTNKRGTAAQPITLQGSPAAILAGESLSNGYVFHLKEAAYWILTGFTLRHAAKGIMLDHANNNRLDHLLIEQIGQEAVHFRTCSTDNTIQYSTIRNTGVITPGFGEGVYIGTDIAKWTIYGCDSKEARDQSDANQILYNHFGPDIRAEAIDVKEGTKGGIIIGNIFDATGLSGENFADSWLDIKGNDYKVTHNRGVQNKSSHLRHGFETHNKIPNWGRHNLFCANVLHLKSSGYGFHIDTTDPYHGNIVCDNNAVSGAELGLSNIPVTNSALPMNLLKQELPALVELPYGD